MSPTQLVVVEDNVRLRPALVAGLDRVESLQVIHDCGSGEEALAICLAKRVDALLLDVQLDGLSPRYVGVAMDLEDMGLIQPDGTVVPLDGFSKLIQG